MVVEVKELVKEGESGVVVVSGVILNVVVEFFGVVLLNILSFLSIEGGFLFVF